MCGERRFHRSRAILAHLVARAFGVGNGQAFTLTVHQPSAFASPDHATFRAGKHRTFTIVTRGFPAARLSESGKLPRGITFLPRHDGTATLTGKASRRARGHTFRITITARGVRPAAPRANHRDPVATPDAPLNRRRKATWRLATA